MSKAAIVMLFLHATLVVMPVRCVCDTICHRIVSSHLICAVTCVFLGFILRLVLVTLCLVTSVP